MGIGAGDQVQFARDCARDAKDWRAAKLDGRDSLAVEQVIIVSFPFRESPVRGELKAGAWNLAVIDEAVTWIYWRTLAVGVA